MRSIPQRFQAVTNARKPASHRARKRALKPNARRVSIRVRERFGPAVNWTRPGRPNAQERATRLYREECLCNSVETRANSRAQNGGHRVGPRAVQSAHQAVRGETRAMGPRPRRLSPEEQEAERLEGHRRNARRERGDRQGEDDVTPVVVPAREGAASALHVTIVRKR